MKKQPNLSDLVVTWMQKELPKAKYEEVRPLQTLMPTFKRFTIMKKSGKALRECFKIEIHPSIQPNTIGWMVIGTSASSLLSEEATIYSDRITFGKWNSEAEVLAADPEFFQKMTMYMTRAAMVVTMGDFSPNLPEPKNVEI